MESRLKDRAAHTSIQPDECRTDLLLPEQVDFARRTFEKFLSSLSALLPGYLYAPSEIQFDSARQCPLSQALGELEDVGCVVLLDLHPFPSHARLAFGNHFLCAALETLLGAPAGLGGIPRDTLTEVDLRILQGLIDLAVSELRGAWQPKSGASFRKLSIGLTESSPAEQDDQSVLVLTAEIAMHESTDTLRLIIPSLLIRLVSQPVRKAAVPAADAQRRALMDSLASANLDVEAVLRGADIRIRDLLALKPGLVLELPHKSDTPVECQINGVTKFRGQLVNSGKLVGFQIESWPETPDPNSDSRWHD